jgi:colicin import membrane protein
MPGTPPGESHQSERARLAAQREAIAARFAADERECRERFAVTRCLDDARVGRREALAPLRQRELEIGDAERRARAEARKASLADKARTAKLRAVEPPAAEVRLRPSLSAGAASAPPTEASQSASRSAARGPDAAARAKEAADRVQALQQRTQASEAAQQRVSKRLADRAASGKAVQPLPPPEKAGSAGTR